MLDVPNEESAEMGKEGTLLENEDGLVKCWDCANARPLIYSPQRKTRCVVHEGLIQTDE